MRILYICIRQKMQTVCGFLEFFFSDNQKNGLWEGGGGEGGGVVSRTRLSETKIRLNHVVKVMIWGDSIIE